MQAMLDKRTHMLKVHQTLGLITAIPMVASLITGPQAKAKGKNGQDITEPTPANLDFHIALGGLTTGLYWTTAYYSIFAPKVPGVKPKGAIRLHRDLEWVHGPGMILTPILGIMAYKQENAGEKVHGIASHHGTVAYVTAAAYGASIVSDIVADSFEVLGEMMNKKILIAFLLVRAPDLCTNRYSMGSRAIHSHLSHDPSHA